MKAEINLAALFTDVNDFVKAGDTASIEIRRVSDGSLAVLWQDRSGTVSLANPFTADADGRFIAFVDPDTYQIEATLGVETQTVSYFPAFVDGFAEGSIIDDSVTLAKLAGGTADTLLGFDASGDPSEITTSGLLSVSASVASVPIASQATSEAGTNNTEGMTPLRTQQHLEANGAYTVSSGTVTNQTSFDVSGFSEAGKYVLEVYELTVATNDTRLGVQISIDGGSSFISTGTYTYGGVVTNNAASSGRGSAVSTNVPMTDIAATTGVSNASGASGKFEVTVNRSNSGIETMIEGKSTYINAAGATSLSHWIVGGTEQGSTAEVDAIRFLAISGTNFSCKYKLWRFV